MDQYSHADRQLNCLLLCWRVFGTIAAVSSGETKRKRSHDGVRQYAPTITGENTMKKCAFILALAVLAASPSLADNMPVNADGLTWGPAPPVLPKGAQIAVLSGDPSKDGLYVLRLKMPANYKLPAHNHPTSEYVTVISGNFHIGMGDKLDENNGVELRAGGFGEAPAHMNHYAWASEDTVVQVHGQGPFAITYVNPADDPSK